MKNNKLFLFVVLLAFLNFAKAQEVLNDKYPGLATSSLTYGQLKNLPEGILLKSNKLQITAKDLQEDMNNVPENIREQLKKNEFYHLEQLATKKLLLSAAKDTNDLSKLKDDEAISKYISENVTKKVSASDSEISQFYENNKDMCGGASLAQVKDQLKEYVLQQKQQEAINLYIKNLGKKIPVELSSKWVAQQAKLAKDNPVDKARLSGLVSVVDFGANGCKPCDMMTPVLANLKKKFEGKANVLFVHVREEPILASRYGIESIPVQVIFDKNGKEVFRHVGFFPQLAIEEKIASLGVK